MEQDTFDVTGPRVVLGLLGLALLIGALLGLKALAYPKKVSLVLGAAGLVLWVLADVGPGTVRASAMREWLVLTGGLVDVGGYRLRIDCFGSGSPTVVMDTGLAQPRSTWGTVPEGVARFTRVCIYDRAGLGESERGPVPRTSQSIVGELDRLLTRARVAGPLVLVGHSFGGLNVRLYASRYPDKVAGLVLIDPSHEDDEERVFPLLAPDERQARLRTEAGANYERVDVLASSAQVRTSGPMPNVPVLVVTSEVNDSAAEMRRLLHSELAHLVPNGRQVIAEKSGHFVQLDRPDLVVDAVRQVVDAARGLPSVFQKETTSPLGSIASLHPERCLRPLPASIRCDRDEES